MFPKKETIPLIIDAMLLPEFTLPFEIVCNPLYISLPPHLFTYIFSFSNANLEKENHHKNPTVDFYIYSHHVYFYIVYTPFHIISI